MWRVLFDRFEFQFVIRSATIVLIKKSEMHDIRRQQDKRPLSDELVSAKVHPSKKKYLKGDIFFLMDALADAPCTKGRSKYLLFFVI